MCLCCTLMYVTVFYIPFSPIPSSSAVSLSSWLSSSPSMLLALKTLTSFSSPSSHNQVCTSSSDQSASSSLEWPGNFLPAKHTTKEKRVVVGGCSVVIGILYLMQTNNFPSHHRKDTLALHWYGSDSYFPVQTHIPDLACVYQRKQQKIRLVFFHLINHHMILRELTAFIYHTRLR